MKRRIGLVDGWRRAWSWLSMQMAGAAVAYGLLSPDAQADVLAAVGVPAHRVPAVLGVLFIVSRLVSVSRAGNGERGGGQ